MTQRSRVVPGTLTAFLTAVLLIAVVAQAGELPRVGFLGLQVGAVSAEEGRDLGIASGVKVLKLVDGGSGKAADIQPGIRPSST